MVLQERQRRSVAELEEQEDRTQVGIPAKNLVGSPIHVDRHQLFPRDLLNTAKNGSCTVSIALTIFFTGRA